MNAPATSRRRRQQGATIVGLLVAMLITGITAAGIMGLIYLSSSSNMRATNKSDSINSARTAIDDIGKNLRMSRVVGSLWVPIQPVVVQTSGVGPSTNIQSINFNAYPSDSSGGANGTNGSPHYPTAYDPYYGTAPNGGYAPGASPQPSPNGWPTNGNWAQTDPGCSGGEKWACNGYCLIVQTPVFDANGMPLGLPIGTPTPSQVVPYMDTTVYRVMPDTAADAAPGTFILQKCVFPATNVPRPPDFNAATLETPHTLLKGITGPLDPNSGNPQIFQYISTGANPGDPPIFAPTAGAGASTDIQNISGVSISFETLSQTAGTSNIAAMQYKTEIYMRNNTGFTN